MLDIKFIKENPEIIKEAVRKKHLKFDVDELLDAENKRLAFLGEVEALRAKQNQANDKVVSAKNIDEKNNILFEMKNLKDELTKKEKEHEGVMKKWKMLMLQVPIIPDMSVPEGKGEEENVEERAWGEKNSFSFPVKDHVELMKSLDMVDFDRGVKVHGFRGYFLKGAGAEIAWALWNYARDFFGKRNFMPFMAPSMVHKEFFYGTGHLPNEAEDIYRTQDDEYLTGTAEVPMMAYHSEEILKEEELPKRYLAFTPCYRREAGSHGKDTKGLIRVHEFFKLEQLILCKADHSESARLHDEINRNYEEFIESMGLPYRRLLICGGDLSASKVKQYDTEVWFPSQNIYREISSASYYHDFQTRRFNIRYVNQENKKLHAHSLNCTAVATPRIIGAIVENFQQADGSVVIPEVLRPYMGGKDVIKPN